MGKTLADINASIDGGKKLKGTNPLLDDIYKRLGAQEEYYADLNKRRGDRLEAEREMRRALKAGAIGGMAAGVGSGGVGGVGGKGNSNILKILKGLGIGLGTLATAVAALKLRNRFIKPPTVIDKTNVDDAKTRNAKATSRDYYRQIQNSDGRTPKGMFDNDPDNRTTFKPNKISGQLFKAQIELQRTTNQKLKEIAKLQDIQAKRALRARIAALENQRIENRIALDDGKMQEIRRAKLLAEQKLLKSQLKAAQLEAKRLKFLANRPGFDGGRLSRIGDPFKGLSTIDSRGNIAPAIDGIRAFNINDPKLKHLSDGDLRRSGFVRTSSGVRILKADGTAGRVVKHDTVLNKIKMDGFKAVSGGTVKSPLSSGSSQIDTQRQLKLNNASNSFKASRATGLGDFQNDPRMSNEGRARFAGSGSALKGVAAILDLPFIAADALSARMAGSSSSFMRGSGKVLGGLSRLLGGSFGVGLFAFIAGGGLDGGDASKTGNATNRMSDMIRAMQRGADVPAVIALANKFVRFVDDHGVFSLGSYDSEHGKMQHDLYAALKSMGAPGSTNKERFVEFYKVIYTHLNPGKTLNVRLSGTDRGSKTRPTQFFQRLQKKDFGMYDNHMNRPGHPSMGGADNSRVFSTSGTPTITVQDNNPHAGGGESGAPPVSIIDSSSTSNTSITNTHATDAIRTIEDIPYYQGGGGTNVITNKMMFF